MTYSELLEAGRNGTPVKRADAIAAIKKNGFILDTDDKYCMRWWLLGKPWHDCWKLNKRDNTMCFFNRGNTGIPNGANLTITLTD